MRKARSWSIDFMHDALVCGRRFRTFNVVGYKYYGLSIPSWQTRACLWQVQSGRIDHQCCKVSGNGEHPKDI